MFKKILLGLVCIVAILINLIAFQPSKYTVTRSITIAASPATVFPLVDDFHQWAKWSPWEEKDPAMKRIFEGPNAGTGAIYRWEGNDDVGQGSMTITESKPSEQILINLQFLKPMESECPTEFTFKQQDQGTMVTWTMTGENNFVGKAFSLFMNLEKMIGDDFEKGLAKMKEAAEGVPANK